MSWFVITQDFLSKSQADIFQFETEERTLACIEAQTSMGHKIIAVIKGEMYNWKPNIKLTKEL